MMRYVALILTLLMAAAAQANLAPAQLKRVSATPLPGAAFQLSVPFTRLNGQSTSLGQALNGKPAVLIFSDFTCTNLCGPTLTFAASGLAKTGLKPGEDFHLVVIGLDPKDTVAQARDMMTRQVGRGTGVAASAIVLRGSQSAIDVETKAGGYHYVYDQTNDQFAHPAAVYVITGDGHIVRVLSSLGLSKTDLRLALVEAGQGRIGSFADQIRLRCFGFDPSRGIYTASITKVLTAAGIVTVVAMTAAIGLMVLAARRRVES
jgi:protein SCO1/2